MDRALQATARVAPGAGAAVQPFGKHQGLELRLVQPEGIGELVSLRLGMVSGPPLPGAS